MPAKIDLNKNTKAEVLKKFRSRLSLSIIEPLIFFTVEEWKRKSEELVAEICDKFTKTVIVRSSSRAEDGEVASNAGKFRSIPNIDPRNPLALAKAIKLVINSYRQGGDTSKGSHILVQEQCVTTLLNGVIFTCNPKNGAPYYIINYDETSSSTSSITSGSASKQLRIFRYADTQILPLRWQKLILAIKEVESHCSCKHLDIEFGISALNEVHIFQIRSLQVKNKSKFSPTLIKKQIEKIREKHHEGQCLSNMAFWNPAEIIGEKPRPLAASLYNRIVLRRSWNTGISKLGYTNTHKFLYHQLAGRTYIDVNVAFLSLLPQELSLQTKHSLVEFYINRLRKDASLHDKIEFEIIPNCYNFSIESEFRKTDYASIEQHEVQQVKEAIKSQTNKILKKWKSFIKNAERKCERTIPKLNFNEADETEFTCLKTALSLFSECSKIDVPLFAATARMAFISKSILWSIKREGLLPRKDYLELVSRVVTFNPQSLASKESRLSDRGHLRIGTYDITQLPYSKKGLDEGSVQESNFTVPSAVPQKIVVKVDRICKSYGLTCTGSELIEFLLTVPTKREYYKFLFTKQISKGLELIAEIGRRHNISREELSYLTYKDLRKTLQFSEEQRIAYWVRKIAKRRIRKDSYDLISLQDCIFSREDYNLVKIVDTKPNYVTNKKITAPIYRITRKSGHLEKEDLENKIVVVESADPGFDWIFEQKIAGLVTKYGGAGSHMAIRCNEYQIPAVLGCGERLYEVLSKSKKIALDCENDSVRAVNE